MVVFIYQFIKLSWIKKKCLFIEEYGAFNLFMLSDPRKEHYQKRVASASDQNLHCLYFI